MARAGISGVVALDLCIAVGVWRTRPAFDGELERQVRRCVELAREAADGGNWFREEALQCADAACDEFGLGRACGARHVEAAHHCGARVVAENVADQQRRAELADACWRRRCARPEAKRVGARPRCGGCAVCEPRSLDSCRFIRERHCFDQHDFAYQGFERSNRARMRSISYRLSACAAM